MGLLTWLEEHEAAVSSLICCGAGSISLAWSVVNPGLNVSRFYASGVAALSGACAVACSVRGLKEEERSIISRDTQDEIFGLYQAAEVEVVRSTLFPQPPMPAPPPNFSTYYQMEFSQSPDQLDFYQWQDIKVEANAVLVGGNAGTGKTSIVAGYIVPLLAEDNGAEIIVLDPDASRNPIWQQLGYDRVISDYEEIFQTLIWLSEEKERRKKRPDNGHQIIPIWDEVNDCQSNWKAQSNEKYNASVEALRNLGNARKYGISPVCMMQNHVVESIGLKKKDRNNFGLVLLGASARDEVNNLWKHNDPKCQWVNQTSYPVVVCGGIPTQIAEHPTHGHHQQFRKKGNAPANLKRPYLLSVRSIPDFSVQKNANLEECDRYQPDTPKPEPKSYSFNLNKPPMPQKSNPIINGVELLPEWLEILELAKVNGSISTRDVYRSAIGQKLKLNATTARYILEKLQEAKLGTVTENNGSCTFTPTGDMT